MLDSDGFEAFKESGNVFDSTLAKKLRENVYEKGSTEEAMDLYVKFRGKTNYRTTIKSKRFIFKK